jgi:hypothetical protein
MADEDKVMQHIGTPRHSGRYPYGSGGDPYQRNSDFLGYVSQLRKEGMSETEVASAFGMSVAKLRNKKTISKNEKRAADASTASRLKEKGLSNVAIGEKMGLNESSVRSLLDSTLGEKSKVVNNIATTLRDAVNEKSYIDVGLGVEMHLGVSRGKVDAAIELLKAEGYSLHYVSTVQRGTGKKTSIKVLTKETDYATVYANRDKIRLVDSYSDDMGSTIARMKPPANINSNRLDIVYGAEGAKKDGVIELRPGVPDLSLGNSRYAQVRVAVDGTHFIKGMAMYSHNLPDGVDIRFNTNKLKTDSKLDVLKPQKSEDNPFGSTVRQRSYFDANGKEHLSPLNIVNEEGDWTKWSRTLSSQVLSKQSPALAKKQLSLAYQAKLDEYEALKTLTNPVVKATLLSSFSDGCDSAAVHLKAAALPRQANQVILPFNSIKPTEIYAPNHRNGETVVLIRHPHGGTFEIPQLKVNNKNPEAKSLIGQALDAVGIHPDVAKKLSGADFDGDTVLVIPNNSKLIKTSPSIKSLQDFNPKVSYKKYPGMPVLTEDAKQLKMGDISNLITDMTLKGATVDEISRAVKHSMVVIDAAKHELNYTQSYKDHGIAALKAKYQGSSKSGAATLISRAKSEARVPHRRETYQRDLITGKHVLVETGETYTNKKGRVIQRTTKSTKLAETTDAFALSSGTRMESIYAEHSNALKALAIKVRLEANKIPPITYSPSARKTYHNEVESLRAKLAIAFRNKPIERQAQLLANKIILDKKRSNPGMSKEELKKLNGQALTDARIRVGAKGKDNKIQHITPREWEAINMGAVSTNTLKHLLLNTDPDYIKRLAMPKTEPVYTKARMIRLKSLLDSGYTHAEIADAMGVTVSTINNMVKEA